MLPKSLSDKIKTKLIDAYNPSAIYLFGSYAWGKPTKESDIDLMVIVPDNCILENPESYKGYIALADIKFSKDLIVIKENNFKKRAAHPSTLQYKVLKEGIKLYGNI